MASSAVPQAFSPSVPQASAARRKKLAWILGASLLLLAGVSLVGLLRREQAAPAATAEPPPLEVDPGVVELEPFVLNLADPMGDRYLRLGVSLVLDRKEIAERASAGLPQVKLRDRVLSALSRKRASELTTSAGKELLREEILATVEPLFSEPPFFVPDEDGRAAHAAHVLEVFFTEFLLQ